MKGYSPNTEIFDRIMKVVADHVEKTGQDPEFLLMGFGTYATLAATITDRHTGGFAYGMLYPKEFEGIPIVIDPGYEFRIVAQIRGDVTEQVAWAARNQRSNKNTITDR